MWLCVHMCAYVCTCDWKSFASTLSRSVNIPRVFHMVSAWCTQRLNFLNQNPHINGKKGTWHTESVCGWSCTSSKSIIARSRLLGDIYIDEAVAAERWYLKSIICVERHSLLTRSPPRWRKNSLLHFGFRKMTSIWRARDYFPNKSEK